MNNIAVAILTSWDIARLRRAIWSVQKQEAPCDLWVEINTTDDD